MNIAELSSKFCTPEAPPATVGMCAPGEVLLAGTVVSITPEACRININGAQYDLASGDITDTQLLSSMLAGKRTEIKDVKEVSGTDLVVFKVSANAILTLHVPVQAAIVAAAGTWVAVTAAAAQAASPAATEAAPQKTKE